MHEIVHAISALVKELALDREQRKAEFDWIKSQAVFVTKADLKETESKIMSAITDWADKEDADLAAISDTLNGIVAGVAALDQLILDFQNSPGTLSQADQDRLDKIQAAVGALKTQAGAISTAPPTPTPGPTTSGVKK